MTEPAHEPDEDRSAGVSHGSAVPTARRRPGPRVKQFAIVSTLTAAMVLLGVGLGWDWVDAEAPARAELAPTDPIPSKWSTGFLLIPEAPPPPDPPTPAELLDARLLALARDTQAIRASVDPPLLAFGTDDLREELEGIVARVDDRAQVSVHVRDLDSGRVLFDYFGSTPLNPASNHKLLTTAAALDLLGPDYMFETRVLLAGSTLYLIGEGDPTIDGEQLAALARDVAERVPAGALTGIVVDDTAFSPERLGPGYAEDGWGASYMAPSGALSVNFNTVEVTVYPVRGVRYPLVRVEPDSTVVIVDNGARLGSRTSLDVRSAAFTPEGIDDPTREQVFTRVELSGTLSRASRGYKLRRRVVDPGMFTGGAFAQLLGGYTQTEPLPVSLGVAPAADADAEDDEHGDGDHLEFPRIIGQANEDEDLMLVAVHHSPPMIEIVGGLLAYSNNFTAEQILRTLGWRMTGDPGDWDNGGAVIRGYWEALGNDPGTLVFENGSGLSSVGRITTRGLVELLAMAAHTQEAGSSLIDALPIAGADGTVRSRLRRSNKRVRAKTGTLDGVSGLTGVITTEAGVPQVAFSILINVRETDRMAAASRRKVEDSIVMAVLDKIDSWEATRGTVLGLPELIITPD